MIFFVNIALILVIFFISLLFMVEKSIKNYLIFSIICLITITLNSVLVHYNIELKLFLFGLSWNILLPLCQSIVIIALTIINKKYLYLIILCLFALDLLLKISMTLILNISFIELNSNHFYYFTTYYLICAIFIYIIISFILYFIFHNKKTNKPILLYVIMALIEIACFFFINISLLDSILINNKNYLIITFVNIVLIIIFLISIVFCYQIEKFTLRQETKIKEYEINQVYDQYKSIYLAKQEELIKIKHDINNILQTINTVKANNNILNEIKEKLNNTEGFYYTSNKLINAVLVNKLNLIKDKNIQIQTEIAVDNIGRISDYDIISLLTNLIDNCVEGCQDIQNPYIKIKISNKDNMLLLFFENATVNKNFKTNKKDKKFHGYGLKIIKDITKRYNGKISNQIIDYSFITYIELKI